MGKRQATAKSAAKPRAPRSSGRKRSTPSTPRGRGGLARPLDTLVFLLPGIVFYEAALLFLPMADSFGEPNQVVAFHLLEVFFQLFGTTGVLMPGLAVVIILLCTQAASGLPWRVHVQSVGWMYVESIALAIPLFLLNHVLYAAPQIIATAETAPRRWLVEVTLSIGAGIYEELVFRLVLISVIVMITVDLLRLPRRASTVLAVLVSAALFAAHHHPPLGSEPFQLTCALFRAAAGCYLGAVFVFRGYGPAAGLHIAYNLLVMTTAA